MSEIVSLDKYIRSLTCLPLIKCKCGYEILLLPDQKAMNKAIKTHLATHPKTQIKQIEQDLIAQILAKINT